MSDTVSNAAGSSTGTGQVYKRDGNGEIMPANETAETELARLKAENARLQGELAKAEAGVEISVNPQYGTVQLAIKGMRPMNHKANTWLAIAEEIVNVVDFIQSNSKAILAAERSAPPRTRNRK